ncbi:hypothetical protein [Streptomyces sp. A0592]|uniref:hypothetical protein n=1 Tax=Streptomyces sp. A0592 TaxID=2563099 RepID=UPI00109EBD4E|nr:hypothetical protein [Streptomyces sp. A0592]THA86886.1 hypothetical protein E6U81_02060 [Streptomyces sp. A0592]
MRRYPIKSTGGERPRGAEADLRGPVGDRLYARFSRAPGQPGAQVQEPAEELPELIDPDGRVVADTAAFLRVHLGRDDVEPAREGDALATLLTPGTVRVGDPLVLG